jgi:hypothetical protein
MGKDFPKEDKSRYLALVWEEKLFILSKMVGLWKQVMLSSPPSTFLCKSHLVLEENLVELELGTHN